MLGMAFAGLAARKSLVLFAGTVVLAIALSWYGFAEHGLLVDIVWPLLVVSVLYLSVISITFAKVERERGQIRGAFSQYMAPELVRTLIEDPGRLKLGGEIRQMTFLFSDIAGFTTLVEKTTPDQLVALLNEYLDRVCALVMDHGGTIDKIVGDAVHAMFNAPLDQNDHAERAVRCALAIDLFTKEFARSHQIQGMAFGVTRIGINTGPAVVGNFGGSRRFDYTAHGDAINTAARLEGANKMLGTSICVSKTTVMACPTLPFRPLGDLLVVGKKEPVGAFEAVPPKEAKSERLTLYNEAFGQMCQAGLDALPLFERLATRFAQDSVVHFHLERLRQGHANALVELSVK